MQKIKVHDEPVEVESNGKVGAEITTPTPGRFLNVTNADHLPVKRKCFYLMARTPFPVLGGDRVRAYNMIKMLREKYELHIVLVTNEKVSQECIDFLEANVSGYKIFKASTVSFYWNSFKAIFSAKPLHAKYYHNRAAVKYCEQQIKKEDIVVAHTIKVSELAWPHKGNKILEMTDMYYLNYLRSKYKVRSLFWKMIYFIEEKRVYKYEIDCAKHFNKVILVNEDEKKFLEAESGSNNVVHLPNGVNEVLIERPIPENNGGDQPFAVSFLGKMDYQPNVDAVMWFANNVLPLCSNLRFYVIGVSPVKRILDLETKFPGQVTVTGLVEDPYEIISNTIALVAPMQTGGGIQNKILEAMAIGSVVLSSSLGAKPIQGAIHKKHLLVCNTPQEYYKAIMRLKDNNHLSKSIGRNARQLIRERYNWQLYKQKLLAEMDAMQKQAMQH